MKAFIIITVSVLVIGWALLIHAVITAPHEDEL